jgi:hypothetical protein
MEDAFEGGLRRVFPTQLQPVQLAKAAARAMEDAQVVGLHGAEVPNEYTVRVPANDYKRFEPFQQTLTAELERYLVDYASDRGLRPIHPPRVALTEDPGLRTVRVDARFVDVEKPTRAAALEEALSGTRAITALPASRELARGAWLEDGDGRRYILEPDDGVLRFGRALDNDVVLEDSSVSRYHAQLRWDGRAWLVRDLGSTNGTLLNGRRVEQSPAPLTSGARLKLGATELVYQEGTPPANGVGG